jgi:hypothetical protein
MPRDELLQRYEAAFQRCWDAWREMEAAWPLRNEDTKRLSAALDEYNAAGVALAALRDEMMRLS